LPSTVCGDVSSISSVDIIVSRQIFRWTIRPELCSHLATPTLEAMRQGDHRPTSPETSSAMSIDHPGKAARHSHPIVFLFLNIPFGAMSGFLTVTVAYLLSRAGVPASSIAELIAISYLPHTWKFLWAPVVDTTLKRKQWYLLSAVASGVGIYATGALPASVASLPMLTAIVLVSNLAVTFNSMAVESLMAHATPDSEKGRAAGWFQAGNLGGYGLGGGAGLWLAERVSVGWVPGAILGASCILCCLGLMFLDEPDESHRANGLRHAIIHIGKDMWSVARSRVGYLGLLICFLPIGTGAASNLFSVMASDWQASADTVAWSNGVMNGLVSAVGCIVGGFICDRMDRRHAYALFGVLMAASAVAMGLCPRTQFTYVGFVLLYAFITGFAYAGFSAVVLEAIGGGAAATKYSVFASLSNMPIAYMTAVDGWAYARWGASDMLYVEAGVGMIGLLVFIAIARMSQQRVAVPA
jgi:MFS transporter, PAT family, beta-lactamase induction signal transducer AmpG